MTRRNAWTSLVAVWTVALIGAVATSGPTSTAEPLEYRVSAVDGKLVRITGAGNEQLAPGDPLAGGDELATGWFSSAELAAARAAARFHLRARTRVRLASGRPGVLLVLEKGRLRAIFDRLTGEDRRERRIETPSAVLAVRGTEYGVAVGRNGATTLVVFEGTVEVLGLEAPGPPVSVSAGEALHVRRGEAPGAPQPHGLSRRGWDRGGMPALGMPAGPPGQGGPGHTGREQGPPPRSHGRPPPPPLLGSNEDA